MPGASLVALLVAGSISGRVVDAAGAPVAGARVVAADGALCAIQWSSPAQFYAANPSADDRVVGSEGRLAAEGETDARGEFELAGLRAGSFTVMAGDARAGSAFALDVATGAVRRELVLQPPGRVDVELAGFARDPTRHTLELVPRRRVANLNVYPRIAATESGAWRSGPLPAHGQWDFVLTEFVVERAYRATLLRLAVDARPGQTATASFDFRSGSEIRGRVLDAAGAGAAHATVSFRSAGAPGFALGATTAADGSFVLRGAPPGAADLVAERWILRPTAGCGVGPRDLLGRARVDVPAGAPLELEIVCSERAAILAPGDLAPAFRAPTLDGGEVALEALRGRVVLVDFWATWCGLCRAELPKLRALHRELAPAGFTIVGVSLDDDPAAAGRVSGGLGLGWPQTALGPASENPVARLYNVAGTPNSFLLDREGRIVAQNPSAAELERRVRELLAQR